MNLFESERKVMDVLWREGSITAGKIAKILNIDIGWNRNTTYTVINKCIKKGYISRGEDKFLCTPVITKDEVKNDELEELMKKYFDNSPVKLFTSVVNLADKQELKKMKKIIKNTANLQILAVF